MAERVVVLSIPQLRVRDVTPGGLASLDDLAGRGGLAELEPAFPGLAASSFATLITGVAPDRHGVIGNAYYDRDRDRVVRAPLRDLDVQAPRIWQRLREVRPGARALLWFAPNGEGAEVDLNAWLDADSRLLTHPPDLSGALEAQHGPPPIPGAPGQRSGEPPRLEATAWALKSASAAIAAERPELSLVRVPYLGQVARRFGPDGREAGRAVRELESVLAPFLKGLPEGTLIVAVTESVVTPVSAPVYPNRVLRDLGLLALEPCPGGGIVIDTARSAAFALADHQLCHIYLNDPRAAAGVASAFAGEHSDGVLSVAPGDHRRSLGLDHPRAGDVVLVAAPDRWFAPDWWAVPDESPRCTADAAGLARITPTVPIDPAHVKGSLGAPPPGADYRGVAIASQPHALGDGPALGARDVARLILEALAVG